jgi:hypothetical protein
MDKSLAHAREGFTSTQVRLSSVNLSLTRARASFKFSSESLTRARVRLKFSGESLTRARAKTKFAGERRKIARISLKREFSSVEFRLSGAAPTSAGRCSRHFPTASRRSVERGLGGQRTRASHKARACCRRAESPTSASRAPHHQLADRAARARKGVLTCGTQKRPKRRLRGC